uniref:Integrase catalytic domain-containing protein n=1 Tax=Nicotiana tabacum TaxID=4097 RepID=A0A1S3XBQ6_TOBAC|nr:PREDICTED: uncharacterized protein LOC107763294 [Nicotiana tabacum]
MVFGDLDHENATVTTENASHASSNNEFEEGVTDAVTQSAAKAAVIFSAEIRGQKSKAEDRGRGSKAENRKLRIEAQDRGRGPRAESRGQSGQNFAPVLISGVAYATNAQKVWTDLQERFDKSVIPTHDRDCVKTKEFIVHLRKQKVYHFLMGLDDSYPQAHSQILMMKPLPSVNQAYAILMSDESQRAVAASAGILGSSPTVNATHSYDSTALYSAKPNFNPKFRKNYNIQCEFCKMKSQIKESCYKIIGYPSDHKFKKKGGTGAYNAMVEPGYTMPMYFNHVSRQASQQTSMPHLLTYQKPQQIMNQGVEFSQAVNQAQGGTQALAGSSSTQAQRPYTVSSPHTQGNVFPFTKDQYDQIMHILNNSTSTSSAQANVVGTSTALLASTSPQEWIIDTGTTNHMVSDANLFTKTSIVTPSKPRTVLLPNGDITPVTHTGDSNISDISTLNDVFYVPQFTFNLLSDSKVTRGLKCFASFYPNFCVFQDLFSGRVREIGRERDGLYFLQKYGGKMLTAGLLAAAGIKSRKGDTTIDVALWHKRLGHVSSIVLRKLFAAKLASINDTINKYSVYPCARQTRLAFPSSCIKTVVAFDLIHLDVWGPYNCATFDGNRYFLTVVDDFTRMTWVFFLLKLKYDVCVVLTQLIVLIQTQFNKVVKAVKSDNGSEFVNSTCTTLFQKYGIIHQRTCVYTPRQHRIAERKHMHILEVTRALRFRAHIPIKYWGHCVLAAVEDIFPFKDITDTSPPIFLPSELSNSSEEQPSLPPVPARHESTGSSALHQSAADVMPSIPPSMSSQLSTGLRRSLRTRQAPIWMKDFMSQPGYKSIPYSIANYVSYDRISPKYQAYLTAFSAIQEPTSFEKSA